MSKRKANTLIVVLIVLPLIAIISCVVSSIFNLSAVLIDTAKSEIGLELLKEELISELFLETNPNQLCNINKKYIIDIIGQTNNEYKIEIAYNTIQGKKKGTIIWAQTE